MSDTTAPIEVTTRFATSVDDLSAAWAFVMERIDVVGPNPTVTIKPVWRISVHDMGDDDMAPPRFFEVVVEGMVHEDGEQR